MGLGKFGLGKICLGKKWGGKKWPGKTVPGKSGLTPKNGHLCLVLQVLASEKWEIFPGDWQSISLQMFYL